MAAMARKMRSISYRREDAAAFPADVISASFRRAQAGRHPEVAVLVRIAAKLQDGCSDQ
jgi:hypothetical protein